MPLLSPFKLAAAQAVAAALDVDPSILAVSEPPDPAMGDLAVGVFPAAKQKKLPPPRLAAEAVAAFQPTPLLASARAAGPYVNFSVNQGALWQHLASVTLPAGSHPIPKTPGAGQTVCVDYSSPNIAKQLAYHHIRSTVLGNALCNLHRALGYRVVGINHLGDWGTTFGMLIAGIHKWGAPEPFDIAGLNALYVKFRAAAKEDPSLDEAGRAAFKKLEDGDADTRAMWQRIVDVSWKEFSEVYELLAIRFDEIRGESAYEGAMAGVLTMLEQKGLTSISDEALVVDLSAEGMPPCLLRKNDGATLYATRDLAAAIYRWETYHFARSLYVVDKGQSLHFKQFFTVLGKAGFEWASRLQHVPFGLVRIGGKKSGTRSGNVVLLKDVLAEAQAKIAERLDDMPEERRSRVAREVGIGAILFANLAAQREKDVDFDIEQVTSFEGDAGPYVQYAHARAASVLRKAGVSDQATLVDADFSRLTRPEEWALGRILTELPDVTQRAAESLEPHQAARYLLDVCAAYSRWYAAGNQDASARVLVDDPALQKARLALTAMTRTTLAAGLALMGMVAPDAM